MFLIAGMGIIVNRWNAWTCVITMNTGIPGIIRTFHVGRKVLYYGGNNQAIWIWNRDANQGQRIAPAQKSWVWYNWTNEKLFIVPHDRPITVFSLLDNNHRELPLKLAPSEIGIPFSEDDRLLGRIVESRLKVEIFETENAIMMSELFLTSPFYGGNFSFSDAQVITWHEDNTAILWQVKSGQQMVTLRHPGGIYIARFSPDDKIIATTCADKIVRLWDAHSGVLLHSISPGDETLGVIFSPQMNRILTPLVTGGLKAWNTRTGMLVYSINPIVPRTPLCHIATSRDFKRILRSDENSAFVYDASTGQMLADLSHNSRVTAFGFSPSGEEVVTASEDGTLRIWRRCFPERWWGHFYRPEVWLTIIIGLIWMLRAVCSASAISPLSFPSERRLF